MHESVTQSSAPCPWSLLWSQVLAFAVKPQVACMERGGACWAALPHDLLARCAALAVSRNAAPPTLLAPARVCRAWAAAYRDDTLWRSLFEALWPGVIRGAELTGANWRERVAAYALALPLLHAGATELPLEGLFDSSARLRRESVHAPSVGGHVLALTAGRLEVAHLGADATEGPTTSLLHSVRARSCVSRAMPAHLMCIQRV